MAVQRIGIDYSGKDGVFTFQYVMDSAADVASLPQATPGSTAIVADKDGALYMVNASGEWKEM